MGIKISDLTTGTLASGDMIPFVDISDLTQSPTTGSTKKVLVSSFTPEFNVKHYGAVGDGVTDDNVAIQACLTAGAGATVLFPAGDYYTTVGFTVSANTTIIGYGARVFNTSTNLVFFTITTGCKVFGLEVENKGRALENTSASKAFYALGTSTTYLSGIVIRDCYLHELEGYGVLLKWCEHAEVQNCKIENVGYSGVQTLSCRHVKVHHNHIKGVGAGDSSNCYNISFTRANTGSDTLSEHCEASYNFCEDNATWKALDTHGGHYIKFIGNTIRNCLKGIELKYTQYPGETSYGAGSYCVISNNTIYGMADGTNVLGIAISGLSDLRSVSNVISNNILYDCGEDDGSGNVGAIIIANADNTTISGNVIYHPFTAGIALRNAYAANITGNTIIDSQSSTNTTYGIWAYADVTGIIDCNNILLVNAALNTHVGEVGIYVRTSATSLMRIGSSNYITFTDPTSVAAAAVTYTYANTVTEVDADSGVTVDGVLIKDGNVDLGVAGKVMGDVPATLLDDTAMSFTPSTTIGTMIVYARSSTTIVGHWALIAYRAQATAYCVGMILGADTVVGTGALADGAGTDEKLNINANTDGKIYISNRTGASVSLGYVLLGD